jgi:hypothetical protein
MSVFTKTSQQTLNSWLIELRIQRLAAKDLDDWEQKRVKRLPGEHDGVI